MIISFIISHDALHQTMRSAEAKSKQEASTQAAQQKIINAQAACPLKQFRRRYYS